MEITYLISAHTDPQHFGRLLRALEGNNCTFIIHIDKKVDINPFIEVSKGISNVHFLSTRFRISWGTISIVKYQMALIEKALLIKPDSFLISLSGLDYPLWSNDKILQYVNSLNGEELICGSMIGGGHQNNLLLSTEQYSVSRSYINIPFFGNNLNMRIRKLLRIIVKSMGYQKKMMAPVATDQDSIPLYKGGAWWGISSNLAKLIYSTYHNDSCFQKYFTDLFAPDEVVVQTIAFNSHFKDKCRLIDPDSATFNNLTPLHYLEYGEVMKVFTESDYETIIQSGKPFARKFMTGISDNLLNYIDRDRLKQN